MKGVQKFLVLIAGLVLALGVLPIAVRSLPYEGFDWLSLESLMYYGDIYEPDNAWYDGRYYQVTGFRQRHTFHVTGDADWIWILGEEGRSYQIMAEAKSLGSVADTTLRVLNYQGELIDIDYSSGFSSDAAIILKAPATERYYIGATEGSNGAGDAYWYDLYVARYNQIYLPLVVKSLRD